MRKVFNLCRSGLLLTAGVMTLGVIAAAPAAMAGQPLTVEVDQSQMIVLPAVPGSVVIGNPTFADATVEGTKLFVHGRTFGTTNMIVMDANGEQMASFEISVSHVTSNAVTLFAAGARVSYNCAPLCEHELQVGDDIVHFANMATEVQKKSEFATGSTSAKSEAPPAPQ